VQERTARQTPATKPAFTKFQHEEVVKCWSFSMHAAVEAMFIFASRHFH